MNISNVSRHNWTLKGLSDVLHPSPTLDNVALVAIVPNWSKVCVIVFIVISMLIGIPGNGLVMTVLLKLRKKTSTDVFIIVIALFDILSLTVTGTTTVVVTSSEIWRKIASIGLCRFHMYFTHFMFLQSTFLITCVGVDRYFKTCKPHSTLFTDRVAFRSRLSLTFLSALLNCPFLFATTLNDHGYCIFDPVKSQLRLGLYGVMFFILLGSSGLLCVLYTRIAIVIRKRAFVRPTVASNILSVNNGETEPHISVNQRSNIANSIKCPGVSNGSIPPFAKCDSNTPVLLEHINGGSKKVGSKVKRTCSTSFIYVKEANQENRQNNITHREVMLEHMKVKQREESRKRKQVNKTTKIMAAITIVFIVSTSAPLVAVILLAAFGGVKQSQVGSMVVFILMRLGFISNFCNPIFYTWLSSAFRDNAVKMLKLCRK